MKELLSCNVISKSVENFTIEKIAFSVPAGYILGVIGRNGCGKTTLLRTMMGMYRLKSDNDGDVVVDGISVREDIKAYRNGIAYVLKDNPFPMNVKVLEAAALFGRYHSNFDMEKYKELIQEYGIEGMKRIDGLSEGQKIRMQIAFAISSNAKVYFFDEPAGNLDVEFRDDFYRIIRELVMDGTKTVIYATHLVRELEDFADYILWLKRDGNTSTVRYYGTVTELQEGYRMIECEPKEIENVPEELICGGRIRETHNEFLVRSKREDIPDNLKERSRYAELEEIMYYEEKGGMV